jgi:glycosyltransferase involved in cell wall biosynthesis
MLINIMDPALRISAGHHLDIDRQVARELKRAGHDVHVYSHADITSDAREALLVDAALTPLFRISPYFEIPIQSPASDALHAFTNTAASIAHDLKQVRAADLWIWPTLFSTQHYACVLARPAVKNVGCIMVEPTYLNAAGQSLWRHTLAQARESGLRFELGVLEPVLRDEYLPLVSNDELIALPYPFDRIASAKRKSKLRKVGFFGNQRDEKGAALLGTLIESLIQQNFEVVVHDSSGCSDGQSTNKLKLVLKYIEDLPAEIASCDLVVIPYRSEEYRFKGSGIVWTALANGVPIVAPAASAPGKLVQEHRAGKLFNAFSAPCVLEAVLDAKADYPALADAAWTVSTGWMASHGLRKFVEALLEDRPH